LTTALSSFRDIINRPCFAMVGAGLTSTPLQTLMGSHTFLSCRTTVTRSTMEFGLCLMSFAKKWRLNQPITTGQIDEWLQAVVYTIKSRNTLY